MTALLANQHVVSESVMCGYKCFVDRCVSQSSVRMSLGVSGLGFSHFDAVLSGVVLPENVAVNR